MSRGAGERAPTGERPTPGGRPGAGTPEPAGAAAPVEEAAAGPTASLTDFTSSGLSPITSGIIAACVATMIVWLGGLLRRLPGRGIGVGFVPGALHLAMGDGSGRWTSRKGGGTGWRGTESIPGVEAELGLRATREPA